ncbi:MOS1T transposase, partial [Pseudoatta argentina]
MSIFVPNKVYLRGILLHYFIQKKSAAEAHRILVQTYGDNALSDTTCRDWFRRFKNNDFELEDKERSGAPKKFQDKELEQLLDEDPSQTLSELGKLLQVDITPIEEIGNPILGNKGYKYKNIIALLVSGKVETSIIPHTMTQNDNKIDYVHWVDPNELGWIVKRGYTIIFSPHQNTNQQRLRQIFVIFCTLYNNNHNITKKNHEKWRLVKELHAPMRRNFLRRRVIVYGYDDLWQADMVEMIQPLHYHYILTIIDVLSKYAWAIPLKTKSGNEMATAIAKIIRDDGRCPKNNLKKHNINHYSTYSVMKASVVERFIRTLKNWIDLLPRLVSDVKAVALARFKVGDSFKIVVQRTNLITYLLEDYHGKPVAEGFYKYEHRVANPDIYLVEKRLRKKGDKVYVKWLGFDNSHNSWIHKNNVL